MGAQKSQSREGKPGQAKARAGLFMLARHVLCRNGVCCPPGGPHPSLKCSLRARWDAALSALLGEATFLRPASPSSSPLFLQSLLSPKMSSLACCLFPSSSHSPGSPGQSSLHPQLQENPATAQPPFHNDHKPSILSYITLPVCIHIQRTHGQLQCKGPEVTLL